MIDPWIQTGLNISEADARIAARDFFQARGRVVCTAVRSRSAARLRRFSERRQDSGYGADQDGDGFVVDLVTARDRWLGHAHMGHEAGGAAANVESRHPAC